MLLSQVNTVITSFTKTALWNRKPARLIWRHGPTLVALPANIRLPRYVGTYKINIT